MRNGDEIETESDIEKENDDASRGNHVFIFGGKYE